MAIVCLASDQNDLRKRLENTIVGYDSNDKAIFIKDLKIVGSLMVLLKDAIKPNLVQTLENTPAIIHGGPFANIAHGCNSVIATKAALGLGDYVVTEAGFGADLGAEKFLDIKCRILNKHPDVVVLVSTLKALKYHGGLAKEDILKSDITSLSKGIKNLFCHIDNLKNKYKLNVIVALNKYETDTNDEIKYLESELSKQDIPLSLVEGYSLGGNGAIDIAKKIVETSKKKNNFNYIYDLSDSIQDKILKVSKEIYRAKEVDYSKQALESIKRIKKMGYEKLPVCIAKTQYSLSDDPKNLECTDDYIIHINDIILKSGAGFVVAIAGNIMTMPGLPMAPAAENIDIDENNSIVGIF